MPILIKERPVLDLEAVKKVNDVFWKHVAVCGNPDLCWEWQGKRNPRGYGQFNAKAIHEYTASRIAYILHNKKRPKNFVLHSCDNPPCVNPKHLRDGTAKENMEDRVRKNSKQLEFNRANEVEMLKAQIEPLKVKHAKEMAKLELKIKTATIRYQKFMESRPKYLEYVLDGLEAEQAREVRAREEAK